MRAKGFFKWTSISIITLLVAGAVLLFTLDLGFLRGMVEERVQRATGRDFFIGDGLSIRLGSELVIQARELRLANPEWAADERFVQIGQLQAVLDPWSLWKGPVVIKRMLLTDVDVSLLHSVRGLANWQMTPQDPVATDTTSGLPFLIETLVLTDANIQLQSPRLDQTLQAGIERLEQRLERDGRIHTSLAGQLNGRPVRFEGAVGPYTQLLSGDNIGLEGSGSLGRIQLSGEASFDNLWTPKRPLINLQITGPDFEELTSMLGIAGLGGGELSLNAVTELTGDGLALRVSGALGRLLIDASSEMPSLAELAYASSRVQISGPNFGRIARLAGVEGWPEEAFELGISVSRPENALHIEQFELSLANARIGISGTIPAFPDMSGAELGLQIAGPDLAPFRDVLGLQGLAAGAFSVAGNVSTTADRRTMVDVQYETPLGNGRISGTLGSGAGLPGSDLIITGKGPDASALGELFGIRGLNAAPWSIDMALSLRDPSFYEFQEAKFSTDGLEMAFQGRLGTGEAFTGNDVTLQVSGTGLGNLFAVPVDYEINAAGNWADGRISLQQGSFRIGDSSLSARGVLDLPPDLSATDLQIEIQSPDLARLGTIDGARRGTVPLQLSTSFSGTPTTFRMEQFQAQLGQSSIQGTFSVDFEPDLPVFDLSITTSALDLKPFQADPADDDKSADRESARDARLLPELAFPMAALTRAEGRFAMTADQVYLQGVTLENNALTGEISHGGLKISALATDGYVGRLLATLVLEPQAGGNAKLEMTVKSKGLVFDLTGQSEAEKQALPAFDIDIELDGTGNSLREAAGALNGKITISSPGGAVKNVRGKNTRALLLAELVSAVSPNAARADVINISCFAAAIDVRDGVLHLKPGIALQSDKLNVYAGGEIDLGSEKIDVNFRTKTRKTIDLSASELFSPYVKLSGTLANPSVALDPKGTLLSGGAAYLSGGLSILAKKALDQLGGTTDPCAGILENTETDQNH